MALIAVQNQTLSNWLKHAYLMDLAYCNEVVTFTAPAGETKLGTVLGKITATGKYVVSKQTANDGSEVPAAITFFDGTYTAGDQKVVALVRGPAGISKLGILLDATFNDATKKAAAYAALEAKGIQVLDTVAVTAGA